mmetsp:Transcript_4207/g.5917  ORF Transcript_4207/g.5917 Transcript_4207/m.5917 type:complete len:271 (+) Transcript_4207:180-992(+)
MLNLFHGVLLLVSTIVTTTNANTAPTPSTPEMNISLSLVDRVSLQNPKKEFAVHNSQARLYDTNLQRLANCPCIKKIGFEGDAIRENMLRLYLFDTSGEVPSGLSHQMSNLRAILVEGLSLGRGILLLPPSLTIKHNFDKQFRYNMWSDFIDLNRSHLTLSRTVPDVSNRQKLQRTLCAVRMADCIAEISEHQLRHLQYDSHTLIPYHNGSISPEINTRHGLLVRGPEPDSLDKVALVRKLPGFPELLSIPITIQFGNTASHKESHIPCS